MITLTHGDISKIPIDGYESPIYHIKDVTFNGITENNVFIPGKSFIINADNWQYAHVIQECIGHYEFLRQYIPDLKIYFVYPTTPSPNIFENQNEYGALVFRDLLLKYNIKKEDILVYSESLTFENIYYVFNFFTFVIKDYIESSPSIHSHLDKDFKMQRETAKIVSELFVPEKIRLPKKSKIFISKRKADKFYEKFMEKKAQLRIDYPDDEEFLVQLKKIQGHNDFGTMEINYKIRRYSGQKEIEDFFEERGYEIVFAEDLGLFEQINKYYNASHIASINGTGCYNAIFSDRNTKVFMINTHPQFYWFFDYLLKDRLGEDNVFVLPKIDITTNQPIPIEEIMEELKKIEHLI
jgi:hypothetical protein